MHKRGIIGWFGDGIELPLRASSPLVRNGCFLSPSPDGVQLRVGSPAWFSWLESHSAFRYDGPAGHFAAHKQRVRDNVAYWQAFRKQAGKLRSVHLGRSHNVTPDRLVASALAHAPAGATRSTAPPGQLVGLHVARHPARLTDREREVLGYLALGWANKDIGRQLAISLSTVKSHVSKLYRKLGVESRTQALAHAYSLGVLDIR